MDYSSLYAIRYGIFILFSQCGFIVIRVISNYINETFCRDTVLCNECILQAYVIVLR